MDPAAPFIYLVGFPGVGKQTVAHEIAKLLSDCRVIDNHLIIDLARALFTQGSPEYEAFRSTLRKEMLQAIAQSTAARKTTFICTGSHGTKNPVSVVIARDFERAAEERGAPFVSVILTCEREEHTRRLLDPARLNPGKYKRPKLVDAGVLGRILDSDRPFEFGCKRELQIDTSGKSAEEVARLVVQFVNEQT